MPAERKKSVILPSEEQSPMPETKLGQKFLGWSSSSKAEFKTDLDKLTKVPFNVLRTVVDKIARTYPACNVLELVALEAEQHVTNAQDLSDSMAVFGYIWDNIDGESSEAVIADLSSLGLLSKQTEPILADLLAAADPFREPAKVAANYLRVGSALFVGIRGTVDFRLRFHKTYDDFSSGKLPTELVGAQQVIMTSLVISQPDGEETVVPFLMDDNDLLYMKKFVRNMERELELSKDLIKSPEQRNNG
jgi:hypothetical protein